MLSLARTLTVSALLSLAMAQLEPFISAGCSTAFTSIALNPEANACLNPTPLLSIFTSPNASMVGPIDTWLSGLCSAPACSEATISAIVSNITTGCPELSLNVPGSSANYTTTLANRFYPVIRRAICLKEGSTNCITQTLTKLETFINPLSLANIVVRAFQNSTAVTPIPANLTCTNCVKAIYNEVTTGLPDLLVDTKTKSDAQLMCGASFVDGAKPAGISQGALNGVATPAGTNTKDNSASQVHLNVLLGAGFIATFALVMGA